MFVAVLISGGFSRRHTVCCSTARQHGFPGRVGGENVCVCVCLVGSCSSGGEGGVGAQPVGRYLMLQD